LIKSKKIKIPEELYRQEQIGVDMGATLTKLISPNDGQLHCSLIETQNQQEIISHLKENIGAHHYHINFTGGKAFELYEQFSSLVSTQLIDEFEANTGGIVALFELQKKKPLPKSIIVSLGTGTSIILNKNNKMEHLGGSAMGGGMLMALNAILDLSSEHASFMQSIHKANRLNVDLQVKDIYSEHDERVVGIFREFTASTLGKINSALEPQKLNSADIGASINNAIGENIGLISCLFAAQHSVDTILYLGGFLHENTMLKRVLKTLCRMHQKKCIFLQNSEFAGALGAYLL